MNLMFLSETAPTADMDFSWINDILKQAMANIQAGGISAIKTVVPVIFVFVAICAVIGIAIGQSRKIGKVASH